MQFGKGFYKNYNQGIEREWVLSNGIGGYSGNSIINANFRSQHAYLNASLKPPVSRHTILAKTDEVVFINEEKYNLASNHYVGWYDEGYRYLQRFRFDNYPSYYYQVQDVIIQKSLAFEYGKNTIAIVYKVKNGSSDIKLQVTPFFNYRDHSTCVSKQFLQFDTSILDHSIQLTHKDFPDKPIKFNISDGTIVSSKNQFVENLVYDFDIQTGSTSVDCHFTPYHIELEIKANVTKEFYFICSIEDNIVKDGFQILDDYNLRMNHLVKKADLNNRFANRLVKASDHFIAHRESTNLKTVLAGLPWFTDWGRDTMIAMQGLTLVTKRFDDAKEILESFSKYVNNGLVPNMFPDEGTPPLYNTVDASLWYFHSVDQYLKYTNDYEFAKKLYPTLKEIIHAYQNGTEFSIYMDKEDYLIHAGSGLDQVTWMDVRINGYVVTPRHGKPVEINALWYNALMFMSELSDYFEVSNPYMELATKVKKSFNDKFWNDAKQCLFDVVDEVDDKVRPNQIYAVSLPRTMLSDIKEKAIVNTVFKELYNTYGLRSLSPNDKNYIPIYQGKLYDRDMAYHMGTTWGFLIGGFITAYCKVNDYSNESILRAKYMLELFDDHLNDGCIDGIAEIFDGDNPTYQRGCYSQAWSVGEVLRAYVEDVLNNL